MKDYITPQGIKILNTINSHGPLHFIDFTRDITKDNKVVIEANSDKKPQQITEGGAKYSRIFSRRILFTPEGRRKRLKTHIRINNAKQIVGLKKAKEIGSIIPAPYFRDMEITFIGKVNTISDSDEEWVIQFGGEHSNKMEMALSNSMVVPYIGMKQEKGLWTRETTHPTDLHADVDVRGIFPATGEKPVGLKAIRYNTDDNKAVHYEMYVDADPLDSNGMAKNNWSLLWLYDDKDTAKNHNFGIKDVTVGVDTVESADFAYFDVRSIIPLTD